MNLIVRFQFLNLSRGAALFKVEIRGAYMVNLLEFGELVVMRSVALHLGQKCFILYPLVLHLKLNGLLTSFLKLLIKLLVLSSALLKFGNEGQHLLLRYSLLLLLSL